MPRSVHLAIKADAHALLSAPELILQQMSVKIFQRRQQLLDELLNERVTFDSSGGLRSGIIERFEDQNAIVRDGTSRYKVPLAKVQVVDRRSSLVY